MVSATERRPGLRGNKRPAGLSFSALSLFTKNSYLQWAGKGRILLFCDILTKYGTLHDNIQHRFNRLLILHPLSYCIYAKYLISLFLARLLRYGMTQHCGWVRSRIDQCEKVNTDMTELKALNQYSPSRCDAFVSTLDDHCSIIWTYPHPLLLPQIAKIDKLKNKISRLKSEIEVIRARYRRKDHMAEILECINMMGSE
jgi:hypothetical protein